MPAIAEAAVAQMRAKFRKGEQDLLIVQVREPKNLQARDVDDGGVGILLIGLYRSGSVTTGIEKARDFSNRGFGVWHERIDQRRFTHAGLAGQCS